MEYYRIGKTYPEEFPLTGHFKSILILEKHDSVEQQEFCRWLCEVGCRYAMTFGLNCENWHDAIDESLLEKFEFGDIPDDEFIMTTWHNDESLEDVIFFAKHAATHPSLDLERLVVFHFGESDLHIHLETTYAAA